MASSTRRPLYGLDIETDTSADGLDPGVASVVAAAVSSAAGDVTFTGAEAGVLSALDGHLASLPPGVIVTWNGGAFDLPFLRHRAARAGVDLGLDLAWDPSGYRRGRQPLPGHLGTYAGSWHGHEHLDAYRAWRALAGPGDPCGLKAVARSEGFAPIELDDITAVHRLPLDLVRRYVASDASVTRLLALRRWAQVRSFVDRLPPGGQLAFG